jgi:hypothetical protein
MKRKNINRSCIDANQVRIYKNIRKIYLQIKKMKKLPNNKEKQNQLKQSKKINKW